MTSDAGAKAVAADRLGKLEAALGHKFARQALLERALLHGSAKSAGRGQSYERMEFVGDRVLGLALATELYRIYPNADEGDLARRFNALVRREACADRALALGIDEAIKLGHSEDHSGGRKKTAILADACEAVLAAVYLDAGFEAANGMILRIWQPLIETVDRKARDPKTALQEHCQSRGGGPPPSYTMVERTGPDHRPHFVVDVDTGHGTSARGEGGSKREAEQDAARNALKTLGVEP
ncbi:MAG: ribonuclease III [Pseudomonadota bacterium]